MVKWPSKTITLNRTKETRKIDTTVVRVEGMEVGREEGRRRESFVTCRQMVRRQVFRDMCPTEYSLQC